jgi:peptidoglycan-N-acetylglucosamine deacetylase
MTAAATVLLTFDFDAESVRLQPGSGYDDRDLTHLSIGSFAPRRGLPRIVELLDRLQIEATFFVPGWTAEAHPEQVRDLRAHGHEIAHHGFQHAIAPAKLSAAEQREDLQKGVEAIATCIGEPPRGFRSPAWQMTPATFTLLGEFGMTYDSSCMGDDRPYWERYEDSEILELPVHWTLDDFPHLGWSLYRAGPLRDPAEMMVTWRREVDAAIEDPRPIVLTCHPELIGRAGPLKVFAEFLRELKQDPRLRFSRCIDLATELTTGT